MTAAASSSRRYRARGAALSLWTDRSPEVILSGPAGTGKSRACLEKLHACCLRWPGTRALIVRKTRESLTESALVTFEEKVLPEGSSIASGPQRRMRQAYHYPNGSEVVVVGLDKPSKVMSAEYDLAYVQETIEITEHDWESLTTRLRNGVMPFQQIIGDTNPDTPSHWIRCRTSDGRCRMYESRHEDNPELWDARAGDWTEFGRQYIGSLDRLTGVRKDRLRHGRWVQAEGVVYEGWDRARHLIAPGRLTAVTIRRYVAGVDWGYTNPGSIVVGGLDSDGRLHVASEVYQTQRRIGWWVDQARILRDRYRIDTFVCDPAEPGFLVEFRAAGLNAVPGFNNIKLGIQAIQDRLAVAGDGQPRLFVSESALDLRDESLAVVHKPTCLAEEFELYSWPRWQTR